MTDVVIRAEGLSKKYVIGHEAIERYSAIRDVVAQQARRLVRSARDMAAGRALIAGDDREEFWALREVDFEIKRGEAVGIIGRNGAGKSTLLKVLSRITEPTEGRVTINGRVASLLEVGTGFHPELTGRENIYLNGAILGMTRAEIRRKFDEIVAFAGVEKFLDTPVKRYSSGMYVRLAFSVAAHLEPEILVVDEVLAVGDAEFQKKCLGKMQDVTGEGRTVLFVSHNMGAVSTLCTRGMLLDGGKLLYSGSAEEVVARYAAATTAEYDVSFPADRKKPSITRVTVDPEALRRRTLKVAIHFESPVTLPLPVGGVVLKDVNGIPVWGSNGRFHRRERDSRNISHGVILFECHEIPLNYGHYLLSLWLADWNEDHDARIDCLRISIGTDSSDPLRPPARINGYLDWPATWSSESS